MSNSRNTAKVKLLDAAAPRAVASSTNASPIEVTTGAAHGYTTGQKVAIVGHAVNTNANGSWVITVTGASTFELTKNTVTGDISSGNGIGGATGTHSVLSKHAFAADFQHVILAVDTDGGGDAAMTVKVVGSLQDNPPDYAQPQSPTNQYSFLQILDLDGEVATDGSTGIILAAADVNKQYEVNVNGMQWIAVIPVTGTQGEITVTARLYNNQ